MCVAERVQTRRERMSGLVHRWVQNQHRHWCWCIASALGCTPQYFRLKYCHQGMGSGEYGKALCTISWPLRPLTGSKLVWQCHHSLIKLANHYMIQLVWVP